MASEITADGHIIAPLNITHPAPGLDLAGFQWAPVGGLNKCPVAKSEVARRLAVDGDQTPLTEDQPPASGEAQTDEQLHVPGGPGSHPETDPPFPLKHFKGSYAGNGFNLIWIPTPFPDPLPKDTPDGPNDNKLILNLTTEQLTFGPTLGNIPNRGFGDQGDLILNGLAYLQTVQNTTNPETGKGDKPRSTEGSGIHFEPGVWLRVPAANFQKGRDTICRMASIPHGTTINAQGFVPEKVNGSVIGGKPGGPDFDSKALTLNTQPFVIGEPERRRQIFLRQMDAERRNDTRREPSGDLKPFRDSGRITTDIIRNPNLVLKNAITTSNLNIKETITFTVTSGNPAEELNAGGTANIAFLAGPQAPVVATEEDADKPTKGVTILSPGEGDKPNAHADFMTATFFIELVEYDVVVGKMAPGSTQILLASLPPGARAPTPRFAITAPPGGVSERKTIKVPGIQIQYSQNVNLNFGPPVTDGMLTWPHVSVATLVPTDPQPFTMKE
ncbi:hypothetical protein B0T14DRAFT_499787 [Immersiella caudata]|uniref:Uncharacterized protein n=1 Tax=Immersiella caudata TaxID=314043 RepID=A0AA40BUW8_9PEZI|nr:hypothetical protein B0T14DRAFT_499787 [Immersiella caudata]